MNAITKLCLHSWLTRGDVGTPTGAGLRRLWTRAGEFLVELPPTPTTDPVHAEVLRVLETPYHWQAGVAAGRPFVVRAHPNRDYLHHGHGFNRDSVAVSLMAGARDGFDATIGRAFAAATYLAATSAGCHHVVTHKQASRTRSDPGPAALRYAGFAAALLWAEGGFQLRLAERATRGTGRALGSEETRSWERGRLFGLTDQPLRSGSQPDSSG